MYSSIFFLVQSQFHDFHKWKYLPYHLFHNFVLQYFVIHILVNKVYMLKVLTDFRYAYLMFCLFNIQHAVRLYSQERINLVATAHNTCVPKNATHKCIFKTAQFFCKTMSPSTLPGNLIKIKIPILTFNQCVITRLLLRYWLHITTYKQHILHNSTFLILLNT